MMLFKIINNLEIKKRVFLFFPELKKWLRPYIPPEKFDDYLHYDYIHIEEKNNFKTIDCAFTFFTVKFVYSFPLTRSYEKNNGGSMYPVMAEIRDKYLEFDQFFEGGFYEVNFNDAMEKVIRIEGIPSKELFYTHLVELDLVNLDLYDDEYTFLRELH